MTEKREAERTAEYDALFHIVREMTAKISDHMVEEERNRAKDMATITEALRPMYDIMDSLPRDERGLPSPYLHRAQHEGLSASKGNSRLFKNEIIKKTGEYAVLAVIVLLASGNWEHILKKLIG
jgi:hypothetical protein